MNGCPTHPRDVPCLPRVEPPDCQCDYSPDQEFVRCPSCTAQLPCEQAWWRKRFDGEVKRDLWRSIQKHGAGIYDSSGRRLSRHVRRTQG